MPLLKIILLALVQGAAELLPVSSSAHVVVAERLLGIDPASPEATLLLVILHTGTMLAVVLYFWKRWKVALVASRAAALVSVRLVAISTALTGLIGFGSKVLVEKTMLRGQPKAEIEQLFGNLLLVAIAMGAAGILILVAGLRRPTQEREIKPTDAVWVGLVQGLCLPFRGFSRSGATISVALLRNLARSRAEEFSFALAVVLTPPVLWREFHRLQAAGISPQGSLVLAYTLGFVCSFLAGLAALKWLSRWLETGRWYLFGVYCLLASGCVLLLHSQR